MKHTLLTTAGRALTAALAVGSILAGSTSAGAAPSTTAVANREKPGVTGRAYALDGKLVFPEGVAYDGRSIYASSVGDGTIYKGSVRGSTLEPFLPAGGDGRTSTAGLAVIHHRIIVAGTSTGTAWVYDTRTGHLIAKFAVPDNTPGSSFINDVTIAPDGSAYLTDSYRSTIYRIKYKDIHGPAKTALTTLDPAFDTSTIPLVANAFNANGIVSTPDGSGLLVDYSASGLLYRIDFSTHEVQQVDLGGVNLPSNDGLIRRGGNLYVVENFANGLTPVKLSADGRTGTAGSVFTYPGADFPTTGTVVGRDLVVVNSQFDTLFHGAPLTSATFTLSRFPIPQPR